MNRKIGSVSGNFIYECYGSLYVMQDDDKYYWGISDKDQSLYYEEIPYYLYLALNKFEDEK